MVGRETSVRDRKERSVVQEFLLKVESLKAEAGGWGVGSFE